VRSGDYLSINHHFEQDYLICGLLFLHFDTIYDICEDSFISHENLK